MLLKIVSLLLKVSNKFSIVTNKLIHRNITIANSNITFNLIKVILQLTILLRLFIYFNITAITFGNSNITNNKLYFKPF